MENRQKSNLPAISLLLALSLMLPAVAYGLTVQANAKALEDASETKQPPNLQPYLGTWRMVDQVPLVKPGEFQEIHRYLLARIHKDKFQVKTVDYFPAQRTRDRESTWKGLIRVDRWNQATQTFTPMEDGTISVGMGGTNGIGDAAAAFSWWAAGRLTTEESDDGNPMLRLHTFKGYAPSTRGNIWRPIDYRYELVSRDLDPKFAQDPRP